MASMLFPNVYNGRQRSGGALFKNSYRGENAKAPDYKGRLWIIGQGWHWCAMWKKTGQGKNYFVTQLTPMTDDEARKYCSKVEHRDPHVRNSDSQGGDEYEDPSSPPY